VYEFDSLFWWQSYNLIEDLFVECLPVGLVSITVDEVDLQFTSSEVGLTQKVDSHHRCLEIMIVDAGTQLTSVFIWLVSLNRAD
jgi:hypothetical protein